MFFVRFVAGTCRYSVHMNLTDIPLTATLQYPYVLESFFANVSNHYSFATHVLNGESYVLPHRPVEVVCSNVHVRARLSMRGQRVLPSTTPP